MHLILPVLKTIGLTEKEARLYIACLECKKRTISVISKKAGIKRSTAYTVINKLTEKGLVDHEQKGKTPLYTPLPPDELLSMHEQRFLSLKKSLPLLKEHSSNEGQENINITTDDEAIDWLTKGLDKNEKIYLANNVHKDNKEIHKRISKKHQPSMIFCAVPGNTANLIAAKNTIKSLGITTTPLSPTHTFKGAVAVCHNRIAFFSQKTNTALCISSPQSAGILTSIFASIWNHPGPKD